MESNESKVAVNYDEMSIAQLVKLRDKYAQDKQAENATEVQLAVKKATAQAVQTGVSVLMSGLNVLAVQTLQDAEMFVQTVDQIGEKTDLPKARVCFVVRRNLLFKEAGFSTYNDWAASKLGMKKSTANEWALVGEYVSLDGSHSIFYNDKADGDFSFSQLLTILRAYGVAHRKEIAVDVARGFITPAMTVKDLTKKLNAHFMTGKTQVEEDNAESKTESNAESKTESNAESKTAGNAESKTESNAESKGGKGKIICSFTRQELDVIASALATVESDVAKSLLARLYELGAKRA